MDSKKFTTLVGCIGISLGVLVGQPALAQPESQARYCGTVNQKWVVHKDISAYGISCSKARKIVKKVEWADGRGSYESRNLTLSCKMVIYEPLASNVTCRKVSQRSPVVLKYKLFGS